MTHHHPIWVGLLDLDEGKPIIEVNGPPRPDHQEARILVRMHHAPMGYVTVPAKPEETLTDRVRDAAETELADALRRHRELDLSWRDGGASPQWAASVACPLRFPSAGGPGVTIAVSTHDRTDSLRECLHTMRQVNFEPLEILVVDNAPSDDSTRHLVSALTEEDPRIRYVCEPRPGLSSARNRSLAEATFDIVACTDDDVIADPGWISACAAGFAADPETECVTGPVACRSLDTGPQQYFNARAPIGDALEPRRYDLGAHRDHSALYPFRSWLIGNGPNFAVRREAITRIGGFDPLLGTGSVCRAGEDLDIFARLILADCRIAYMPSALVWHRPYADLEAFRRQMYGHGQGLGAYMVKHLPNRDLRSPLVRYAFQHAAAVVGQALKASEASQLGTAGKWLELTKARGIAAGGFRYYRAAHWGTRSSGDGGRARGRATGSAH
jgi:cellulose synthase/poly-beta-1,6-N-acetylglucosamine synthase-like glycosyltransferase